MTVTKGSKTFLTASLLSITGGYLDAYTYVTRGGVFANAQTGNVIKLSLAISKKNTEMTERYIASILAFCLGTFLVRFIEDTFQKKGIHTIRRTILSIEILLLFLTGFMPQTEIGNLLACVTISFVCSLQMEAFRSFQAGTFATTVSTGNLRKGMECFYDALMNHDQTKRKEARKYFIIVVFFSIGIIIGNLLTSKLSIQSVWVACLIQLLVWFHIHVRYQKIK